MTVGEKEREREETALNAIVCAKTVKSALAVYNLVKGNMKFT